MTNIDDSNATPPGYWFGELNGRLRDRMREELHDLGLGRRGWRILHTLADGPATAKELAATLPRHGRRDRVGRPERTGRADRHDGADHQSTDDPGPGDRNRATDSAAESGRREWRGHPDWMRREWERRQQMYRDWMEHDRQHPHPDPREHGNEHEHEHEAPHSHEHEHEHEHDEHKHGHEHEHGPHSGGHGSQQAFERGFERGFVRGFERATPFGPGRFGPGFGPGRFGRGPYVQAHGNGFGHPYGHGHAPFAGRGGCRDHIRGGVDRILADFVERGWVWFDGDNATLTDEGRAAHDAAFERIRTLRASVSEGIDPADLATTLATLEAMARNLGWVPTADADESTSRDEDALPTEQADREPRGDGSDAG